VLFPRFSIRSLIALTFVAALCAYSVARAVQGEKWAMALATTIGIVASCMVSFGFLFAASWAFGSIVSLAFASPGGATPVAGGPFASSTTGTVQGSTSPFASTDRLPPQVMPDLEPPPD
jgi:hypothetical protein